MRASHIFKAANFRDLHCREDKEYKQEFTYGVYEPQDATALNLAARAGEIHPRLKLGNCVAVGIRYPDVGSVKSHTLRVCSRGKRAEVGPVARAQLGHVACDVTCHPDVASVKCQEDRIYSHWKRAQIGSIARAQFGHVVAAENDYQINPVFAAISEHTKMKSIFPNAKSKTTFVQSGSPYEQFSSPAGSTFISR
jgi:hypothetical protein